MCALDEDEFNGGESVVIIDEGYFEGENAIVCHDQEDATGDEIYVEIEKAFDWIESNQDFLNPNSGSANTKLKMNRRDIAVWDYPEEYGDWGDASFSDMPQAKSIPDSRSRLFETLNTLKTNSVETRVSLQNVNKGKEDTKFTSSRERKAASKNTKKQKKKKR